LLVDVGTADPHAVTVVAGDLQLGDVVDHPPRRDLLETCQRDVLANVVGQDQPELLAVLGDIGKAGVDGGSHARQRDLVTFEGDAAADPGAPGAAEQAHGEFGAAGAHQPGDADDLAALDAEIDVL